MTDLLELVHQVTGLHADIAADLIVAGGILRCEKCQLDEPLGSIETRLRSGWPAHCGRTMLWIPRKQVLAAEISVPEGYELVAAIAPGWRLSRPLQLCRAGAGPGHTACGRPAVAEMERGTSTRPRYYGYCADDMGECWAERGQVWHWVLRPVTEGKTR